MKKQILAVAVAGAFAIPALASAETSTTLYGQMHAGLTHWNYDNLDNEEDMTDQGRTRIGVRSSTDLGNGMNAFARFEWSASPHLGGSGLGRRQSHIGMDGDFGQIAIGSFHSVHKQHGGTGWDPLVTTELQARRTGGMAGGNFGTNSFVDKGIQYKSPQLGPVTLTAQTGFSDNNAPGRQGDGTDLQMGDFALGAHVDLGAFELIAAYTKLDEPFSTAPNDDDVNWKVGGRWSDGPFSVAYQYEDIGILSSGGGAARIDHAMGVGNHMTVTDAHKHHYLVGTYSMGRNNFVLSFGHLDADSSDQDVTTVTGAVVHRLNSAFRVYAGLQHMDLDSNIGDDQIKVSAGARFDF
ncbi:hypothetical protein TVD_09960 [Thioalkalivibrio versutus]|uniref:Porin domain-containing protein n=2 Tax=Thioalkalivibrio versutus TaxID=106634 RepID=A0A0G3GA66_9GAMM|nr:hypothetical protein TVD_09960 [Thioalkalivibrio versutus]